jgi:hypothetical protein
MGKAWFETVAEAQRRASKRLPASVDRALIAGSQKGLTVTGNVNALSELGFAPRVAGGHSSVHDLTPDDIVIPPGFTRALGVPGPTCRRPDRVPA